VAPKVSYLDISGVHDGDAGTLTFFAVNRHGSEPLVVEISLEGFGAAQSVEHTLIKHQDLEATNTKDNPDNVKPVNTSDAVLSENAVRVTVPPYSYSMIRVRL
jgi:alpha-L-arabinofuranosidase